MQSLPLYWESMGKYGQVMPRKVTGNEFQEPRVNLLISRFIPMIEECNSQALASTAWALAVLQVGDVEGFGGFTRPNLPHKWLLKLERKHLRQVSNEPIMEAILG